MNARLRFQLLRGLAITVILGSFSVGGITMARALSEGLYGAVFPAFLVIALGLAVLVGVYVGGKTVKSPSPSHSNAPNFFN